MAFNLKSILKATYIINLFSDSLTVSLNLSTNFGQKSKQYLLLVNKRANV